MLKSTLVAAFALSLAACGHSATSQVASHKHSTAARGAVSDAAAVAGNYAENKAEREEWNQGAPFTGTLSLVLVPGTAGGSFVNVDEAGKKTTGKWSVTVNGALDFGDDVGSFGYELTATTLTVIGDHDESRSVLVRN